MAVEHLLQQRRAGPGKAREHGGFFCRQGTAGFQPSLKIIGRERFGQSAQVAQDRVRLSPHWPFSLEEDCFALEHCLHRLAIFFVSVVSGGNLGPGLSAHLGVCLIVGRQFMEKRFRRRVVFQAAQQSGLEKLCFHVARIGSQTVFNHSRRLFHPVTALVENCQFQAGIGNFPGHPEHTLEAINRLLWPENHPVTLAGQVEEIRLPRAKLYQPVQHFFRALDFKARSQRAAGIHQGDEVLRMCADRLFKKLQRFLETIGDPERAGRL